MKTVVLLYHQCCIYEIAALNYFLNYSKKEVLFVSLQQQKITSMEGYHIEVDCLLSEVSAKDVELLIIPGGRIQEINQPETYQFIRQVYQHGIIGAICAGVDVLEHSGILANIDSTHSLPLELVVGEKVITAHANKYIDFAIEVAKKMKLFTSEQDLQETIQFWKYFQHLPL